MTTRRPYIVGLGGTTNPHSCTEQYLRIALNAAAAAGATTKLLGAAALRVPTYEYGVAPDDAATQLVQELRRADGIILASPAYHGSVSGLVKNALDYAEDTSRDERPYLSGRAVGCMAVAAGWQAAVSTLAALRGIVHALRGWPTPLGIAINSSESPINGEGWCNAASVSTQIDVMVRQVVEFALLNRVQAFNHPEPQCSTLTR